MRAIYKKIFQLAIPYLRKSRPEDVMHTRVVASLMEKIIKGEGLENEADVLLPAAILHDIGWSQVDDDGKAKKTPEARFKHMREGMRIAQKILKSLGYPKEKIKKIGQLISAHDNQYVGVPVKNELAKRLIEADNLWVLSKEAFDYYCQQKRWTRNFLLGKQKIHIEKYQAIHSPTAVGIKNKLMEERKKEIGDG